MPRKRFTISHPCIGLETVGVSVVKQIIHRLNKILTSSSFCTPFLGKLNEINSAGGDALGEAFVKEREAIKSHAASSSELWRKITFVHRFLTT
jgi:hypothetical protein